MRHRHSATICGSKGVDNKYDPQVGAAANANAATAARAQDFAEKYYAEHISPLVDQMTAASKSGQDQSQALFDINYQQTKQAADRYNTQGIGAEDSYYATADSAAKQATDQYSKYIQPGQDQYYKDLQTTEQAGMKSYTEGAIPAMKAYYDQAKNFSTDAEYERQAGLAVGDVKQAAGTAQSDLGRKLASMGIDPSSPAAISAINDLGIRSATAQASASNQARTAARALGMQLTSDAGNFAKSDTGGITAAGALGAFQPRSDTQTLAIKGDAANFARGGTSQALGFGQQAQNNATSSFGIASGAVGSANSGASVPMAGYNTALTGYSANLKAYTDLSKSYMDASAQQAGGVGQLVGTAIGAYAGLKGSDRRFKTDIEKVVTLANGVVLYAYRYIGDTARHIGVMAQEVMHIPGAVHADKDGYLYVDYGKVI